MIWRVWRVIWRGGMQCSDGREGVAATQTTASGGRKACVWTPSWAR